MILFDSSLYQEVSGERTLRFVLKAEWSLLLAFFRSKIAVRVWHERREQRRALDPPRTSEEKRRENFPELSTRGTGSWGLHSLIPDLSVEACHMGSRGFQREGVAWGERVVFNTAEAGVSRGPRGCDVGPQKCLLPRDSRFKTAVSAKEGLNLNSSLRPRRINQTLCSPRSRVCLCCAYKFF